MLSSARRKLGMGKTKIGKFSFTQFEKCELCQVHHRQKHRHVYSRKHQQNVRLCLSRFKKKIVEALSNIKKPLVSLVLDTSETKTNPHQNKETNCLLMCSRLGIPLADEAVLSLESDSNKAVGQKPVTFWCYFCHKELPRDEIIGDLVVRYGCFWQHLQSSDHCKQRDYFWRRHKVDSYHKYKKEQFSISEDVLKEFKEAAETSLKEFMSEREMKLKKEVKRIQKQERFHQMITQQQKTMLHHQSEMNVKQLPWKPVNKSGYRMPVSRVRTIAAEAQGLSTIKIKEFDEKIGNIHTGALPPWLKTDNSDSTSLKKEALNIGPTKEDYEKYLAKVKRGKLPPGRVGAKEQMSENQTFGSDWLPSFGRVWSKNPRTQVRKTFMANLTGSHAPSSTVTRYSPANSQQYSDPHLDNEPQYPDHQHSNTSLNEGYISNIDQKNNYGDSQSSHHGQMGFSNPPSTAYHHQRELVNTGYVKRRRPAQESVSTGRIQISDKLLESS